VRKVLDRRKIYQRDPGQKLAFDVDGDNDKPLHEKLSTASSSHAAAGRWPDRAADRRRADAEAQDHQHLRARVLEKLNQKQRGADPLPAIGNKLVENQIQPQPASHRFLNRINFLLGNRGVLSKPILCGCDSALRRVSP